MTNYEPIQRVLLKIIDSLKPDLPSHEMALLGGKIALPWSDTNEDTRSRRIADAVLAVADAVAKVHNYKGCAFGIELASKVKKNIPIIELVNEVEVR